MLLQPTNASSQHHDNSNTYDTHSDDDDNEDADICVDDDVDENVDDKDSTPSLPTVQGMDFWRLSFSYNYVNKKAGN